MNSFGLLTLIAYDGCLELRVWLGWLVGFDVFWVLCLCCVFALVLKLWFRFVGNVGGMVYWIGVFVLMGFDLPGLVVV